MPPRGWRLRLEDILEQIRIVLEDTAGFDWPKFRDDRVVHAAVLYRIGIIGEAVAALPEPLCAAHPEVPWAAIRATRNILTHVYFQVRLERIWQVVEEDLVPLRDQLQCILESEFEGDDDASEDV